MSILHSHIEPDVHLVHNLALITIRQFENARIEFDAYRMDLELASGPANEEAQRSFAKHKVRKLLSVFIGVNCKHLKILFLGKLRKAKK